MKQETVYEIFDELLFKYKKERVDWIQYLYTSNSSSYTFMKEKIEAEIEGYKQRMESTLEIAGQDH